MPTKTKKIEAETEKSMLIRVGAVARLIGCSQRTVYRLAEEERMPAPVRINSMVRFDRSKIEEWIRKGCKPRQTRKESKS
jgi:excisionase family DNA binding protein